MTVTATAGANDSVEPFENWVGTVGTPGDGAKARANLNGSESTWDGGVATIAWTKQSSDPATCSYTGVAPTCSFVDSTALQTQALLQQDIVDITYTLRLTITVGGTTDYDEVLILVRASDAVWDDAGTLKPARLVLPTW